MELSELRKMIAKQSWDRKTWMELQIDKMIDLKACCPVDGRLYCSDGLEQELQEITVR